MDDDQTPIMASTSAYQLDAGQPRSPKRSAPLSGRLQDDPDEFVPSTQMETCLGNTSTKWFQTVMFVAFLAGLVLSIVSKYDNLSAGVIWGSVLSMFSVVFVIVSYASVPSFRQHPNPLMFWRTIADGLFVLQLLAQQFTRCLWFDCKSLCNDANWQCGCSLDSDATSTCSMFAGFFEVTLIASEAWFCCMTLNLLLSLTNPFTDFKRNTRMFHIFCWGLGLALGGLLVTKSDWTGFSDLEVCWTNTLRSLPAHERNQATCTTTEVWKSFSDAYSATRINWVSWGFFYVWLGAIIMFGIVVWIWAWKRLSEGMPETYAIRVQSINRTRFNVLAVTIYWLVFIAVYIPFLARTGKDKDRKYYQVPKYLLAGKGYVDLVIWFSLNEFRLSHFAQLWKSSPEEAEVDLGPQVNAALRREVLFYTTSGIVKAVRAAERLPASQRDQTLALLPQNRSSNGRSLATQSSEDAVFDESQRVGRHAERSKTFHDYEPHAFKRIRERFGVTKDAYIHSVSATAKERLSEGASGAFMFFSADGSLIVKSTSKEECTFLRSIAQRYANYLCNNPKSLLTRFYGCHCLELYGKQFSFVVMANLFDTDQIIHSRYDIKGSWVNRHADLPKRGKKVTCRHCNMKYVYQHSARENANCQERLGGHEPNVVLKDMDLTQKLRLDTHIARELYDQLCADSGLLASLGILDYSLLMGINEVEYVVDEASEDDADQPLSKGKSARANNNGTDVSYNPFNSRLMADSRGSTLSSSTGTAAAPTRHHFSVSSGVSNPEARNPKVSRVHDGTAPVENREYRGFSNGSAGRRLPRDGMRMANTVVGPAYYHLGIIDILQTWTVKKRMERFFKVTFKGADPAGLSCVPPDDYKKRFQVKMADILDIDDVVTDDRMDIMAQQTSHMDVDTTRTSHLPAHSMRRLPTNDHHILQSLSNEYADARVSTQHLRHRGDGSSVSSHSQKVGQDTMEDYQGIDYHL